MTSPLKIANNTFEGKEYTPRTNSLNQFYAKALKLQKEYAKYEYINIDEDIRKGIASLKPEDADYPFYAEQLIKQKYLCSELFLTTDLNGEPNTTNAQLLNEIMLTEQIDHIKERNEGEYLEYLAFMVGLLIDFFQKFNPLRHFGSQLIKLSQATQSEMKSD